jgi:hypothetical protein
MSIFVGGGHDVRKQLLQLGAHRPGKEKRRFSHQSIEPLLTIYAMMVVFRYLIVDWQLPTLFGVSAVNQGF